MGRALVFLLVGLALGAMVRFPTFAILAAVALSLYAAIDRSLSLVVLLLHHLVPAALALQIGYFIAVAAQIIAERHRRRGGPRRKEATAQQRANQDSPDEPAGESPK